MRTHLTRSTHLFALRSMCYLPEWSIVNNNNKYTEYKWDAYPLFTRTANMGSDCTKSDGKIEMFLSFWSDEKKSDQFWLFV